MEQIIEPMDLFTKDHLHALLGDQDGPCISILMPAHQKGIDVQQDPIRLKNLLRKAESGLKEIGARTTLIEETLSAARALVKDIEFWQYQHDGLALFLTPDSCHIYRLPYEFEELVVVGDHFHLKPLLIVGSGEERCYVLALSKNDVRLLKCTRYTVDEVDLGDTPQSLNDILKQYDFELSVQFHTGTTGRASAKGRRDAVFHGHGGGADEVAAKKKIDEFLRKLDKGVCERLATARAPLVLAGVEYVRALYRNICHYDYLLEEGIDGNPEKRKPKELQQEAWSIVAPLFHRRLEKQVNRYEELAGSGRGRTANDLRDVVPAAYYQRVETLFVPVGRQHWGVFDPNGPEVSLHEERQAGDEDLLNVAAVHTLRNGGDVFALADEAIPGETPVAAIYR